MAFVLPGQGDPIYETWVMLLNGYGYNGYRKDNQLRADDLLVRQQACHFVVEAAKALQEQETAYSRRYLPQPSREQPFPPPERMVTHALIRETRQGILALEARIRGLSAPATDRIWQRHRNEVDVLQNLARIDVQFVGLAKQMETEAGKLNIDSWDQAGQLTALTDSVKQIEQVIAERSEYLLTLVG